MASSDKEAIKRLNSLSECCICLMTYKDPRLLPCFHTACLKCFEDIQSKNQKKPGDVLKCPLCREEFLIPPEGSRGLPKNFFVESLMEVTKAVNLKRKSVACSICSMMDEMSDVTEAMMKCLNCCENYCFRCSKIHKIQKLTKDHKVVEINSEFNEDEIRNMFPIRKCKIHSEQVLNYYCSDCKTVVCASCFVEIHISHECKDVTTVDKDFRRRIEESSTRMSDLAKIMAAKKGDMERQKEQFLATTIETEHSIRVKTQELKALIEQHSQIVLDKLSLLREKHQNKMATEIEEIERKLAVMQSFVTYCTEFKSKGSPSEVCGYAENLITRATELSKEILEFVVSVPCIPVKFEFVETDQDALLQNVGNVIGKLSESMREFQSFLIVICNSKETIKINLNRPDDVSYLQPFPTVMQRESAAAVYFNSIFVTGIGQNCDEIWRLNGTTSKWKKCASLVQGRQRHSVAFVDHVLYICGGLVDSGNRTLDDVEAYDAIDDKCTTVGKLLHAVQNSGNCVPFKTSLYIFGGYEDNNKDVSNVQVYDTKLNTCRLLANPMPRAKCFRGASLWENTVLLFGSCTGFIYNFDTGTWEVRDQFRANVHMFGLTINEDNIFIIERMNHENRVKYVKIMKILKDEPIAWRHHATLPKNITKCALGKIDLLV